MDPSYKPVVYDIEDCARLLKVSRNHAYQLARSGVFPTLRLGRRIVSPKGQFHDWLESGGRGSRS